MRSLPSALEGIIRQRKEHGDATGIVLV